MGIKFSIIVVCYNAGGKLSKTVNSILEQEHAEFEILVKDGLSVDGSLQTLPEDARIQVTACGDRGIYDAMNQAVKKAGGDYYCFLNCGDTFAHKDVLQNAAAVIALHPDSLIFYGNTYNEMEKALIPMPEKLTPFTCYRHFPCHQACIYHNSLFAERAYHIKYRIRGDYEHFLWCYFRKNANPKFLGDTVASYEGGGFSEAAVNREADRKEHQEITALYMSRTQLFCYRSVMLLTLAPVRRWLGRQSGLSGIYNGIKKILYKRR